MELEKLFETQELVVINKLAGWISCEEAGQQSKPDVPSVSGWARKEYAPGASLPRAGVVHRLDKGTSGCLLVAKDVTTYQFLQQQFKDRKVQKTYIALVSGKVPARGIIQVPIGRNKNKFGAWSAQVEGKYAKTEFVCIKTFSRNEKYFSLIRLHPLTGRTHQIRVHCSYMGWPLVGDKLYGGDIRFMAHPFSQACCTWNC
jgi:23S rRNA pseudouridine1911/1915/1917 synthase